MATRVSVIGAGSFGAWTALRLQEAGCEVTLIDAYGPANSRASSGGESRIIRMGYGARGIYTRWSILAMESWAWLATHDPTLLIRCGALWFAPVEDSYLQQTVAVFEDTGVSYARLNNAELRRQFPQFRFRDVEWGIYEPAACAILARRSIQTLVRLLMERGARYEQRQAAVGEHFSAEHVVFACGPWLPKIFPDLLGKRILPSRQEVLYFGPPADNFAYGPETSPCWIDVANSYYGLPDLENRGFKIAFDKRGPQIDPDTADRNVAPANLSGVRDYLAWRIPALAQAPLLESRVCQYENTATSDYILDRHPEYRNIWIAGGGSGHGFKHGPAVAQYMKELILDGAEPREPFLLSSKPEFAELTVQSSF